MSRVRQATGAGRAVAFQVLDIMTHNRKGYDLWSTFYDEYPNSTVAADELSFPRYWAGVHDKRILEIGCGTGRHTKKLAPAGNSVTAIDPSSGMLAEARQKLAGTDVVFVEGDFLTHEFPVTVRYDLILESLVLEHLSDLEAFFSKCYSLLEHGGQLMLSEIHPSRARAGILAHFRDPIGGEEFHLESFAHAEEDIVGAAVRAGFRLLLQEDVTGDQLAALNRKWEKHVGQPMTSIWVFTK